jgi:hypothetical protein
MCRLALRRLALSARLARSRCHDLGKASEPPISLVGQARRMLLPQFQGGNLKMAFALTFRQMRFVETTVYQPWAWSDSHDLNRGTMPAAE